MLRLMKKILVIDDEESIRYNLVQLLTTENFDAIAAEDGRLGLHLAFEVIPDLILCDVLMPELDGYEVLKGLRQNPVTATIPFIFLTAKDTKADLRQGMELGADDYITKPFTIDELLGAIATRLEKQAAIAQRYTLALQQAAQRLNHLVYYDSLTGLPNRLLLRERLHRVVRQNTLHKQLVPVVFLDLNKFSRINQTLGPSYGDQLLKAVAQRLTACVGADDTVAHLSADRFIIILKPVAQKSDAAIVAQAILDALSQPFILDSQEVFITARIGIAVYPSDGSDIDTLIQRASSAISFPLQHGGNDYQFYTSQMPAVSIDDMVMETALHRALEREEFQVYYQPQVNLQTGQIVGAEALLRWQHPERGLVPPGSFIPLAEKTGLIVPIGEWVLKTACFETKVWRQSGVSVALRVSVNLSPRQFSQPDLRQKIVQIIQATGFDPLCLELELTESTLMQDVADAIATLSELQALGIKIAVDDFGTGYTFLSYLKQFPFTTLKLDRCFVRNVGSDPTNTAITTAIIQLAHNLNLEVIAEGVETEAELAYLRQQGCDFMQGFLFSRPLPAAEFEQMLAEGKHLTIKN